MPSARWLSEVIKTEVRPRTEAVCLAGLVDGDLAKLCVEFTHAMATPSAAGVMSSFVPMCSPACWHSCSAASRTDIDGFETCRGAECADTQCAEFLARECPAQTRALIERVQQAACTYSNPSPPVPPLPPPIPPQLPSPPGAPPPPASEHGVLRRADTEQPFDLDCLPVTYSACLRAAQELAKASPALSPNLELSQAACEGTETDVDCFVGCALGNELGAPGLSMGTCPSPLCRL